MEFSKSSIAFYLLLLLSFGCAVFFFFNGFSFNIFLFLSILWVFFAVDTFYKHKTLKEDIEHLYEWLLYPNLKQPQYNNAQIEEIEELITKFVKSSQKRKNLKIKMDAKLKLKNRQRNDMIAALAHEFRNPIAAIVGYASTLQEDKDMQEALRDRFLDKIYKNSQKIESLLARLILWNKFENGQATFNAHKFSLLPLAKEVKNALLEKYPYRIIEIHGDDRVVEGDRVLLEIVVKNLIENALKYSKNDVNVYLHPSSFEVVDGGVGISEQNIEKITKKFFRSGEHSWDNSMGLGLSIVKKILHMHHSELRIVSEVGKGSSFSFNI